MNPEEYPQFFQRILGVYTAHTRYDRAHESIEFFIRNVHSLVYDPDNRARVIGREDFIPNPVPFFSSLVSSLSGLNPPPRSQLRHTLDRNGEYQDTYTFIDGSTRYVFVNRRYHRTSPLLWMMTIFNDDYDSDKESVTHHMSQALRSMSNRLGLLELHVIRARYE